MNVLLAIGSDGRIVIGIGIGWLVVLGVALAYIEMSRRP